MLILPGPPDQTCTNEEPERRAACRVVELAVDRGADGVRDARLKFKVDFPMEQAALNGNAQVRALTSPLPYLPPLSSQCLVT